MFAKINFILLLTFLISCSKSNINYSYPQDPQIDKNSRSGKIFSSDITLYKDKEEEISKKPLTKIKKESKLFQGAKDFLLNDYEFQMMNAHLGIISTAWKVNLKAKTRRKINILVRGEEILEKNLDISIYEQYLDSNYKWRIKNPKNKADLIKSFKEKIIKNIK